MKIKCDKCGKPLKKKGALIFSPPAPADTGDFVQKFHICTECWHEIYLWIIN